MQTDTETDSHIS